MRLLTAKTVEILKSAWLYCFWWCLSFDCLSFQRNFGFFTCAWRIHK